MSQYCLLAARYLAMILIALLLKIAGVLCSSDRRVIGSIIMNVTLPSVIITSFASTKMDLWFLVCFVLGVLFNLILLILPLLFTRKCHSTIRALWAVSAPGYNLGNITLPFLQNIFPDGIPFLTLFDAGDSLITFGGTYMVASALLHRNERVHLCGLLKTLLSSTPFVTYLVMIFLSCLHFHIPDALYEFFSFCGESNAFLAMTLIGISLDFRPEGVRYRFVVALLLFRLATSVVFSLVIYCLFPSAPLAMRQCLSIAFFSTITNVSLVYAGQLQLDVTTMSLCSTISTLLNIPLLAIVSGIVLT